VARNSNKREISAVLNLLGEDSTNNKSIEQTVNEYILILELINSEEIDGSISVKPTQVGLNIGYDERLRNLRMISKKAASLGKFMWIDIKSFQYVKAHFRFTSIYLRKIHREE
jgi:proline dehydrogenase